MVLVGIGVVGCASMPKPLALSDEASEVRIIEYVHPDSLNKMTELTMLRCELDATGATRETHVKSCENHLRNQAAKIGADLVLVDPVTDRKVGVPCDDYVLIKGIALKSNGELPMNAQQTVMERLCGRGLADCGRLTLPAR